MLALIAVVLIHLAVTVAHGSAHTSAHVDLGPAGLAFVILIIMIGPLAGLAWMRANPRIGALVIAVSMTGALLFGVVNHFVIAGPDRVDYVTGSSHAMFEATASLLAITEAAGATLGFAYGWRPARRTA